MHMPDKNKLATQIRVRLAELDISNKDLAEAMRVTQQTITNMKRGDVSYNTFDKAFRTLDNWE